MFKTAAILATLSAYLRKIDLNRHQPYQKAINSCSFAPINAAFDAVSIPAQFRLSYIVMAIILTTLWAPLR